MAANSAFSRMLGPEVRRCYVERVGFITAFAESEQKPRVRRGRYANKS